MKLQILSIVFLYSFSSLGQTAMEYFESGKLKQEESDFENALKDYSSAIEMDSTFAEAYCFRAALLYDHGKYEEALTDLNQSIHLNSDPLEGFFYIKALLLRGEINLKTNNKEKACNDFMEVRRLGIAVEQEYLEYCGYKEEKPEYVLMDLPDKNNWKITYVAHENDQRVILSAYFQDTINEPAEYSGLISSLDKKHVDLTKAMDDAYQLTKAGSPNAQLSFIEKDLNGKTPWIMYLIENVRNEDCDCEESQIWYLTQGEYFHSCYRSIRKTSFTNKRKEEIKKIFKTSKIVHE